MFVTCIIYYVTAYKKMQPVAIGFFKIFLRRDSRLHQKANKKAAPSRFRRINCTIGGPNQPINFLINFVR
ncbi:hypothetical protein C0674_15445 [Sporolactobacillus terrae]|uniref:Uncharacterized protein n=1 Tax=Sporolactobacillus terrae TaxID=269673 RepID=A0ABX5QB16_9BACL|nr:hypothetical protein C0674_15445 [Sporolactobacillus terrae]QAA26842.1 hypothetical protein C0679_15430 [Sporolactobacillus terrae]